MTRPLHLISQSALCCVASHRVWPCGWSLGHSLSCRV